MGSTSRSNWTQYTKNQSISKDHAELMLSKGYRFIANNNLIQCSKCQQIVDRSTCYRLPASNNHVCLKECK